MGVFVLCVWVCARVSTVRSSNESVRLMHM